LRAAIHALEGRSRCSSAPRASLPSNLRKVGGEACWLPRWGLFRPVAAARRHIGVKNRDAENVELEGTNRGSRLESTRVGLSHLRRQSGLSAPFTERVALDANNTGDLQVSKVRPLQTKPEKSHFSRNEPRKLFRISKGSSLSCRMWSLVRFYSAAAGRRANEPVGQAQAGIAARRLGYGAGRFSDLRKLNFSRNEPGKCFGISKSVFVKVAVLGLYRFWGR
jgi:hypothetical protein